MRQFSTNNWNNEDPEADPEQVSFSEYLKKIEEIDRQIE